MATLLRDAPTIPSPVLTLCPIRFGGLSFILTSYPWLLWQVHSALHCITQPSTLTLSARPIVRRLAPTSKHSLLLFHSRNSSHSPQTHTIQFSSLSPFQPTSLLRDRWKSRLHDAQHVSTFTFDPHPLSAPTTPYLVLQLYTLILPSHGKCPTYLTSWRFVGNYLDSYCSSLCLICYFANWVWLRVCWNPDICTIFRCGLLRSVQFSTSFWEMGVIADHDFGNHLLPWSHMEGDVSWHHFTSNGPVWDS